ncbi:MAG TPA: hypothetical protein VFL12_09420 [Thermoanaerobaculia bacterium]|nr:hypothetical protein [Thermoanaerobaculia bacterium]
MAKTGGDRPVGWGVDTVFGLSGDGINGIMEALRKNRERIAHFTESLAKGTPNCGEIVLAVLSDKVRELI